MQSRTLPLLILALLCGGGAAYLAWYYSNANRNDPEVKVFVPKVEIKGMSRLNDPEKFQHIMVRQSTLRQGDEPIKEFDDIKNHRSKDFTLAPGKPFYKSDVVLWKDSAFASRLAEDEVALTVRVSPEDAGAGFINVGDKVDIIAKVPSARNDERAAFKIVFQNIEVLGVNQQAGTNPDGTPMPPQSLTLRFKREDSPKMALYRTMSQVNVVLRKSGYNETVATAPVFVGDDLTGSGKREDEPLLTSPGAGKNPGDVDVPAPPAPTAPAPSVPAPTQPQPTNAAPPPPPEPPAPAKTIKLKTLVVEGGSKKEHNFEVENEAYKKYVENKDGKIKEDEKPKTSIQAPAK